MRMPGGGGLMRSMSPRVLCWKRRVLSEKTPTCSAQQVEDPGASASRRDDDDEEEADGGGEGGSEDNEGAEERRTLLCSCVSVRADRGAIL
jgi:hypothetical protein